MEQMTGTCAKPGSTGARVRVRADPTSKGEHLSCDLRAPSSGSTARAANAQVERAYRGLLLPPVPELPPVPPVPEDEPPPDELPPVPPELDPPELLPEPLPLRSIAPPAPLGTVAFGSASAISTCWVTTR